MLKVARSTERAIRSGVEPEALGESRLSEDAYTAGIDHQFNVNRVLAYGCGVCCGRTSLIGDGTRMRCALLVTKDPRLHLEPEERQKAEACKVPQLYADVVDGKVERVKEEDVLALVPEFLDLEQLREMNSHRKSHRYTENPEPAQPEPASEGQAERKQSKK
jgi:hypothetical protein